VQAVEYLVDGAPVGRSKAFPWQVPHRFAPGSGAHTLEARIERADGGLERARIQVYSVSPDAEVAVEMVPLTVTVTNQQYFFVRTLQRKDFLVYEDGVLQDIEDFDREPTPLTVLVLAESSFSMNGRRLEMATEGVRALARALEPGDRLGVASFAEDYHLLAPFDAEPLRAAEAMRSLRADGGTAMFDAELQAVQSLAREPGHRVLVLLGDGEDYLSRARLETVIDEAHRANVVVYAVGLLSYRLRDGMPEHWTDELLGKARPAYWSDRLRVRGLKFLRQQAEQSGGILYMPRFTDELPYVFAHFVSELKSTYSLSYYPKNPRRDGRFRAIEVVVDGQGLEARTRKGYYATGDEPTASAAR
jgi:VWFA-related protein